MTTATKPRRTTKTAAKKMWAELHNHFANAQQTIEKIIATRAWEPLGYASFGAAWSAEMGDITLASELRGHVVYVLLGEGYSPTDIAEKVKGVSTEGVRNLARQRENGVPPEDASVRVRSFHRRPPGAASTLRIPVGATVLQRYARIAKAHDSTVEAIAAEAVAAKFKALS